MYFKGLKQRSFVYVPPVLHSLTRRLVHGYIHLLRVIQRNERRGSWRFQASPRSTWLYWIITQRLVVIPLPTYRDNLSSRNVGKELPLHAVFFPRPPGGAVFYCEGGTESYYKCYFDGDW